MLVAPSTSTPVSSLPTPLIYRQTPTTSITHLDQKLRLDTPARLALALSTRSGQRVDLIDEDDCRLLLSGHGEELLDKTTISRKFCRMQLPDNDLPL